MFSPDDLRVMYRADQMAVDQLELFSVTVAYPGVSTKVNSALVFERDVSTGVLL